MRDAHVALAAVSAVIVAPYATWASLMAGPASA